MCVGSVCVGVGVRGEDDVLQLQQACHGLQGEGNAFRASETDVTAVQAESEGGGCGTGHEAGVGWGR
jgi:hypothetical protein